MDQNERDVKEAERAATHTQILMNLTRITSDHERRLRLLERGGWILFGIATVFHSFVEKLLKGGG